MTRRALLLALLLAAGSAYAQDRSADQTADIVPKHLAYRQSTKEPPERSLALRGLRNRRLSKEEMEAREAYDNEPSPYPSDRIEQDDEPATSPPGDQ